LTKQKCPKAVSVYPVVLYIRPYISYPVRNIEYVNFVEAKACTFGVKVKDSMFCPQRFSKPRPVLQDYITDMRTWYFVYLCTIPKLYIHSDTLIGMSDTSSRSQVATV